MHNCLMAFMSFFKLLKSSCLSFNVVFISEKEKSTNLVIPSLTVFRTYVSKQCFLSVLEKLRER